PAATAPVRMARTTATARRTARCRSNARRGTSQCLRAPRLRAAPAGTRGLGWGARGAWRSNMDDWGGPRRRAQTRGPAPRAAERARRASRRPLTSGGAPQSIEPVQWRNRHCPELAGGRTNEDRSTEVDWMKFLYSLNTQADHKWSMIDLWRLYEVMPSHSAACAGHESSQFCWGSVVAAGAQTGTLQQADQAIVQGRRYGIDENLSLGEDP